MQKLLATIASELTKWRKALEDIASKNTSWDSETWNTKESDKEEETVR